MYNLGKQKKKNYSSSESDEHIIKYKTILENTTH